MMPGANQGHDCGNLTLDKQWSVHWDALVLVGVASKARLRRNALLQFEVHWVDASIFDLAHCLLPLYIHSEAQNHGMGEPA